MASPSRDNWVTQLRKGTLALAVLAALAEERRYGYALVRRLEEVMGGGVGEGTVYPLLNRLSQDGLVRSTLEPSPKGPARKYYELTPEGHATLAWLRSRWDELTDGLNSLMADDDG